jgi:hypothetical protein
MEPFGPEAVRQKIERLQLTLIDAAQDAQERTGETAARLERSRALLTAPPARVTALIDRQQTMEHLALAEEHVALGAKNVARQREIIAELRRDGHDTTAASALLVQFEEAQALHVATATGSCESCTTRSSPDRGSWFTALAAVALCADEA